MSLPSDFFRDLQRRSDADLYGAISRSEDYLPEALDAIRQELSNRNLPLDRVEKLEANAQTDIATEQARRNETLSWPMRLLMLAIGNLLVPSILIALSYSSKGFRRKCLECVLLIPVSIVLWFIGMLLVIGFSK